MNITVKGLADFMTANPARQRTILREYKYPNLNDARAKIHYYREARDTVVAYHKGNKDEDWLRAQIASLLTTANVSSAGAQKRLRNNARALTAYAKHFGGREFDVLAKLNWKLVYSGVSISVQPDLHVREKGTEKIIKLEFSVEEPEARAIKIISQCMFEAARTAGLNLPSASVLLFDVARGASHKGARLGAYLRRDVSAACDTIADIWPKL
jgi:hypothetical protein